MSVPVETPQHQAQRAPRRSGRKPRPPEVDGSTISAVLAAVEPQRNPSPAAATTKNNNKSNKGQQRKSSNATDKPHGEAKHVLNPYEKGKATPTPMKQAAYAGSTFQQSPAASALPLPSFYSKSLPNAGSMPVRHRIPESASPPQPDTLTRADESASKHEATPCDFLFQAARQARASSRAGSPAVRSGHLSVPNGSPASRSPAPREGDAMFPFELDGVNAGEDGSAFATPYKARLEALRSISSGGKSMDDAERKAKTEALKKLLTKSGAEDNANNDVTPVVDMNNPFNARAPSSMASTVPQASHQVRAMSNPSTPLYTHDYNPPNFTPMGYHFPTPQTETPKRPTSSRLRHVYGVQGEPEYPELSSDSAVTPPASSQRKTSHQPPQYNTAPYGSHPQMPTHRAKPSAQQLEDDLRRVLKLDLVSRG